MQHEYTVILQYLYHDFVTPDCEVSHELRMEAINEMQHMGWFSEELAATGIRPEMEHTEVDLSCDTAAMLEADIAAERAVTMDYNQQIEEIDDEELKALLARVRDHEVYHDAVFSEMLEEVRERKEREEAAPEKTVEEIPLYRAYFASWPIRRLVTSTFCKTSTIGCSCPRIEPS